MRKVLIVFTLFLLCQSASAQLFSKEKIKNNENFDKARLSWGFFLGLNNYDFQFTYAQDLDEILSESTSGFNVGLISDLRINEHLNLRFEPGLFISQRNILYNESYFVGREHNDSDLSR